MKQIVFTLLAICFAVSVQAQSIATDSKGNPVLQLYAFENARFDFSSKDFTFTVTSKSINKTFKFFSATNDTNVIKKRQAFFQVSILNTDELQSLSDISGFRPGGKMKIVFQNIVDSINPLFHEATFGGGFALFASVDNIKLYNESINIIEKRYPFTIGVEGNLNLFLPKLWAKTRWAILSFNMSASNGWNNSELKNYKDITNVITTPSVVAFDNFDGKFGTLKTRLNNFRLGISLPINLHRTQLIPYVVHSSSVGTSPLFITGTYLNIVLGESSDFNKLKVPSAFGIGIDWVKNEKKWTSPNIFIRGAFTIGKL